MVAIVVTALGLLGLMAVYTFGTQAGKNSPRLLEAERHAMVLLETVTRQNRPFESGFPPKWMRSEGLRADEGVVPLNAAPFATLFDEEVEGWERHIQMRRLGETGRERDLVEVTVKVGWREDGRERWIEVYGLHRRP